MFGGKLFGKPQVDRHFDCDTLSRYIDGDLPVAEVARLEQHLAICPECLYNLETLQHTITLLRELPMVAVPRAFTLCEADVAPARPETRGVFAFLRVATAAVAIMLAAVLAGDLIIHQSFLSHAPQFQLAESQVGLPTTRPVILSTQVVEYAAPQPFEEKQALGEEPAAGAADTETPLQTEALTMAVEETLVEAQTLEVEESVLEASATPWPAAETLATEESTIVTTESMAVQETPPAPTPAPAEEQPVIIETETPMTASTEIGIAEAQTPTPEEEQVAEKAAPIGIAEKSIDTPTPTLSPEESAAATAAPLGRGDDPPEPTATATPLEESLPEPAAAPEDAETPGLRMMVEKDHDPTLAAEEITPAATPPTPAVAELEAPESPTALAQIIPVTSTPSPLPASLREEWAVAEPAESMALEAAPRIGTAMLFRLVEAGLLLIIIALGAAMIVSRPRRRT